MVELWKTIPSQSTHEASNLGRIRGKERYVNIRGGRQRKVEQRILSIYNNCKGYPVVRLFYKGKLFYVHRLIAETWIPNKNNLPQVNHINGVKSDNISLNLEWCSASENIIHAFKTGLKSGKNRVIKKFRKLDPAQVRVIKDCLSLNVSIMDLSKYFKVKYNLISNIKSGNIWKNI